MLLIDAWSNMVIPTVFTRSSGAGTSLRVIVGSASQTTSTSASVREGKDAWGMGAAPAGKMGAAPAAKMGAALAMQSKAATSGSRCAKGRTYVVIAV